MMDGEMNVLFDCKEVTSPDNLKFAPVEFVRNKELVQEYLSKMESIPHIRTVITMEPTVGLKLAK